MGGKSGHAQNILPKKITGNQKKGGGKTQLANISENTRKKGGKPQLPGARTLQGSQVAMIVVLLYYYTKKRKKMRGK